MGVIKEIYVKHSVPNYHKDVHKIFVSIHTSKGYSIQKIEKSASDVWKKTLLVYYAIDQLPIHVKRGMKNFKIVEFCVLPVYMCNDIVTIFSMWRLTFKSMF